VTVHVLLCYVDTDRKLVNELKKHLSMLSRHMHLTLYDPGSLNPGANRQQVVKEYFEQADIILLFVSAGLLASEYCYTIQMQQAIERHERRQVWIIPIILRPCVWQWPPLDKLQPLPEFARPVVNWKSRDDGFVNVVQGIIQVVELWNAHSLPEPQAERKNFIMQFDQLIQAVNKQLQPPPRAQHIAGTLQQLSIFVPVDVTLSDIMVGWRVLSHPHQSEEEPAIVNRRITCNDLATLASQLTGEEGSMLQAIKTWSVWHNAFQRSDDPRQIAMATTFERELGELKDTSAIV
jgi:hypothetical protein